MTLNGNTLSDIKNGSNTLTLNTDYTVAGSTVTILKGHLAQQSVGTTTLTFDFSAGSPIDPKGEIARETLVFFQDQGYNVKVFNLVDMANSDRWNPLDEVTNDLDAQLFTQIVIANTVVPGVKKIGGDAFWDRAEQNLLKALTLYVKMQYPKERQTVADL